MPGFRLYSTAQQELEDIWLHSFERWGEAQADRYIHRLYDCFGKLVRKERTWRQLPELSSASSAADMVFFCHEGRHYIFFRELKNGDIGILGILHDTMDIPLRLSEDLRRMSAQDTED